MTGYLLDTHVVLWWFDDPRKLSDASRQAIENAESAVFVSAAAIWEMGIKKSLGRLDIPSNLSDVLSQDSIRVLNINLHHALAVADLPMLHHDPFDRMQVAQAKLENLTLITRDKDIPQYQVEWLQA